VTKLKTLTIAWKIYKSKKYKNTEALIEENRGKSFIGILCCLLKDKLNLKWVNSYQRINVGKNHNDQYMPAELRKYFNLCSYSGSELDSIQQKNVKNLYELIRAANL
jgi:hypothetical protein